MLRFFYYIITVFTLLLASDMNQDYYKYNDNGRIIIPDNDQIEKILEMN